ncbi:MAG: helix-turn-helix transcriptional regulator [Ruminococcaceae bacterium]|nr:helix-turn-helix transcriptional regulator [Oscillospiraceae bacterium]
MKIKELRERAGMTQTALAETIGTTQACVAGWEAKTSVPRTDKLPKLAKVLGCSIDELFEE